VRPQLSQRKPSYQWARRCGAEPPRFQFSVFSCQFFGELSVFSRQLSVFRYAARCWGASQVNLAQRRLYFWPEPQARSFQLSAVSRQLFGYAARCWGVSHVNRAQQRLYVWPEPQGQGAFLAGCGAVGSAFLQNEPDWALAWLGWAGAGAGSGAGVGVGVP